jgi:sugar fermentation stimulation protein A
VDALPIRSSQRLECELAHAVDEIASWSIPGFGCSDCRCESHLFGMTDHPLQLDAVHDLLAWHRMDRLGA